MKFLNVNVFLVCRTNQREDHVASQKSWGLHLYLISERTVQQVKVQSLMGWFSLVGRSAAQVQSLSKFEGVLFSISVHTLNYLRKKIRIVLKQVSQHVFSHKCFSAFIQLFTHHDCFCIPNGKSTKGFVTHKLDRESWSWSSKLWTDFVITKYQIQCEWTELISSVHSHQPIAVIHEIMSCSVYVSVFV